MWRYRGQIPMLPTDCIEETLAFYRDQLGFNLVDSHEEAGGLEWLRLRGGDAQVMFYSPMAVGDDSAHLEHPESMVVYLQVEGLDALHGHLQSAGEQVSPLRATFYGMNEFELVDPNGYTLIFGELVTLD
jgi:uncharacterized glyoxalase superfamily protein PhnB